MVWILLSAAASAISAPAVRPADPQQIVVEGQRSRARAIHDFVAAVTPSRIGGQLSRFDSDACPAAVGLPEAQNQRIAARLRQVAEVAGVPLAPPGCRPNSLVIVVSDKDEFIAGLKKRYPIYFADPVNGSVKAPHEEGPATAWHIKGMMNADRMAVGIHTPGADGLPGRYTVSSSTDASRLRPQRIPHFLAGVVVVEARALAGLTTTQLADYAALRLYAATDPQKLKPSASSILGVLDAPMGSAIPLSLTSWDLSFLKGLYHSDDRQFANRQRSQIEGMVRRGTSQDSDD